MQDGTAATTSSPARDRFLRGFQLDPVDDSIPMDENSPMFGEFLAEQITKDLNCNYTNEQCLYAVLRSGLIKLPKWQKEELVEGIANWFKNVGTDQYIFNRETGVRCTINREHTEIVVYCYIAGDQDILSGDIDVKPYVKRFAIKELSEAPVS